MMPFDLAQLSVRTGSIDPDRYAALMQGRAPRRPGAAAGLTPCGVNLVTLEPGALASRRHRPMAEDGCVMVTAGACIPVTVAGETETGQGNCAGVPAGRPGGHPVVNRSDRPARFTVVGTRAPRAVVSCSDLGLRLRGEEGGARFTHRDGTADAGPR